MFSSKGLLNTLLAGLGLAGPLQLMYTGTAVIVGITAVNLPFMVLTLQSVIEGIDPSIEEAALTLGAGPLRTFRRVILPLAMPGVMAGTILVFILGMNAYATPVLLGGPRFQMMGPVVYGQFAGLNNWPFGAALSFVLMTATLSLTVVSNVLVQRRYRQ
jgi:putative spermidine/putrescine transport system permease protein